MAGEGGGGGNLGRLAGKIGLFNLHLAPGHPRLYGDVALVLFFKGVVAGCRNLFRCAPHAEG